MLKNRRTLKVSPEGKLPRRRIKQAVSAIHVFPARTGGQWKVREMGLAGLRRTFDSKQSAVAFARDVATRKHTRVLVHDKLARLKVGVPEKVVYEVVFDE